MMMLWLLSLSAHAMSLDAALRAAEGRSPVMSVADAGVDEARARVSEARGRLLPSATVSAAAVAQTEVQLDLAERLPDIPLIDPTQMEPILVMPGFQVQGAAELTQPLIAPPVWSANRAARAGVDLAEAERDATRVALRRGVVEAWHRSAEARALVADAGEAVAMAERLVERGEAMVTHGVASADQILPFRRALASARAGLASARAGAEAADGVLAELTGVTGGADAEDPGTPELPALPAMLGSLARADLEAADKRVAAASAARKLERTGLYPTVAAKAGLYVVDPAPDLMEPLTWRVTVGASIPLFQGGAVGARVDAAEARVVRAQAGGRAQRQQAEIEIRAAHGALAASLASLEARAEAVELAGQGVTAAEARLDAGSGSLLEVQQAQAELVAARTELTRARAAARKAHDALWLAATDQPRG